MVQRIKAVETETRLLVVDKETDEYLCSLRLTCTEEMAHSGILLGSSISPSKSVGSDNGEVWKPQLELNAGSLQRHSHSFSSHSSRKVRAEPVAQCGAGQQDVSHCKRASHQQTFCMWLWGSQCVRKLWVSCPMALFALLEAVLAAPGGAVES